MIGTLLNGRFRIIRPLGTGNFGKTFLAEDTHIMDAKCAVKRLTTPKDANDIDIVRDKFKLEAKKLHALNHQGIPKLISYFEYEGEFYLAQDLIDGHTLDEEIHAHNKWTESQVKDFLLEMLEILAYVHSQGSIHRDLKPNNMMRRHLDKKLMLIDFGAVKEVRNTATNLEVGKASGTVVIGTAAYMPAEQAQGKPCYASDVYALGCIAIEALIGISPDQFDFDPYSEIKWRDRTRVSDEFAAIVDKMVRYDWRQRYRNAGEVLEVLQGSQAVIEQPIKEVEKSKTKKPPVAKQAPKAKPARVTEKVVKESNPVVPNQATQKTLKFPIDFSAISTRRKFIIGLAAATPLLYLLINKPIFDLGLRWGIIRDASHKNFINENFKGAKLDNVDFSKAILTGANMQDASLVGANFYGANLDGVNFTGANLKRARLIQASVVSAEFNNAQMNFVELAEADLTHSNFATAKMEGAKLKDSKIGAQGTDNATIFSPTTLLAWQIVNEPKNNRNLADQNLVGLNLSFTSLMKANLTNAKLNFVDMTSTDLYAANLTGAQVNGVNWTGANLTAINLTNVVFDKGKLPKTDETTTCTNGKKGPCKFL